MSAFHVLNTDASMRSGEVAIGVVLRQKRPKGGALTVIGYISRKIQVDSITDYKALIKGLELARFHKPTDLYVYSDSASVVNQVNEEKPRFKNNREKLEPLHRRVHDLRKELGEQLKTISISYLPREMNTEADQRAADAFIV
jgi:ribonuclease HI